MVLRCMFICQSSLKVFFLLLFQGFKRAHALVNGNRWEDTSDSAIFNANPCELSSLIVIKVIIA